MNEILKEIGFEVEDFLSLEKELIDIGIGKLERFVMIMKKYGCNNMFVKEIINKRKDILMLDYDRLEYILDAIISNDDSIEETLLEII